MNSPTARPENLAPLRLFLACVVLIAAALPTTGQVCGQQPVPILGGPFDRQSDGHLYYILQPSCWSDAEATAVSMGGHLVTLNESGEMRWVAQQFSQFGGLPRDLWIGLYDPDPVDNATNSWTRRAEFAWSSGQLGTTAWLNDEPDASGSGVERYAKLVCPDLSVWWFACFADAPDDTLLNGIVEIGPPLEIVAHPFSLSLPIGGSGSLSATAYGNPPISYQWFLNTQAVLGATNATLLLTNAQPEQAGKYRLRASNAKAVRYSEPATVSVANVIITYGGSVYAPPPEVGATNIVAAAVGSWHVLAQRADGRLTAWGENRFGETVVPMGTDRALSFAAGSAFSLAVREDGTLISWGQGRPAPALSDVISVSARYGHAMALKRDGSVVTWEQNTAGYTSPFGLGDVVAICCGSYHDLALKADGTVVGWGANGEGQLNIPNGLNNVVAIAAANRSIALKADGSVVVWGGRYGDAPASATNVVAVSADGSSILALKDDGQVVAWGGAGGSAAMQTPPHVVGIAGGALMIAGGPAPTITVQPWDRKVEPGAGVMLVGKAVGAPPLCYQWQFNGVDIPTATQDSLKLWNVQLSDTGDYTLVVSNGMGMTRSKRAHLQVGRNGNCPPALRALPDRTINAVTSFIVDNGAADPDLPNESFTYELVKAPPGAAIDSSGTISWKPRPEDVASQWEFTTVVRDAGSLAATNSFKVFVLGWPQTGPVGIAAGPMVYPANRHMYFMLEPADWTNAEATAVVMGGHLVTVNDQAEQYWLERTFSRYDGVDRDLWIGLIDPDPSMPAHPDFNAWVRHFVWVSGQPITFFCWTVPKEPAQGVGRIKMAKGDPGWAEEAHWVPLNAIIEIPLSLEIVSQPDHLSVGIGRTATFGVVADSTAPINYQWSFMGTNLPGATRSSLTITNAQPADAGLYSVSVSNICGQVTSETVLLSVSGIVGWGIPALGVLDAPSEVTNVVALTCGGVHCVALRTDGRVVAWGDNSVGQLNVPPELEDVTAISAGHAFTLALRTNGTVVGWGQNYRGQVDIPAGLTNVLRIAAGGDQCLALTGDRKVVAWGLETQVPPRLKDVVAIATGGSHSMALKADGTVVSWGCYIWTSSGGYISAYVPEGLSNVVAIAAGSSHSLALRGDGTVVAWGWGSNGETNVPVGLNNVVAISAGTEHSVALTADGKVWNWGHTFWEVKQPNDLPNIVSVSAGGRFTLALLRDGAPHWTIQPWDQVVAAGAVSTLTGKAIGMPSMTYQWQLNSQNIAGATNDNYTVQNVRLTDAGSYTLLASNPMGTLTSRPAMLSVAPVLPAFTNHIADVLVNPGQTVTITNTPLTVPWKQPTFELLEAPEGAVLASDQGVFTWRPPVDAAGSTNLVQVLAMDQSGITVLCSIVRIRALEPVSLGLLRVRRDYLQFQITGPIGPDYMIQTCKDLGHWTDVLNFTPESLPIYFVDTNSDPADQRYYRVLLGP